ncbi:hypothetical protein BV25DRAFT_1843798 [Artomyces pyxidatus]|uniref:Uncharacterized protein n=1 Tax=Artomyces pyxidatus TaxID=48021 RepID=A0ACB8SE79_9AGAM|nr:hypothetical protein BV25DRAFT_1843798 [Artomyces pyxidatus]
MNITDVLNGGCPYDSTFCTALARRLTCPRDHPERTSPAVVAVSAATRSPPSPRRPPPAALTVAQSHQGYYTDDFTRLKISSSPHPAKLYNWDTDAVPVRRTAKPEATSDASSHASRPKPAPHPQQQLFNHRRDDPVSFAVQKRPTPTPKHSANYV